MAPPRLPLSAPGAYGEFLTYTLGHAATVVVFGGLILGAAAHYGAAEAAAFVVGVFLAFVVGVFLASLSWQGVLVAAGVWRGRRFSSRARRA